MTGWASRCRARHEERPPILIPLANSAVAPQVRLPTSRLGLPASTDARSAAP